ncbi:GSK-3-binding protein-like [Anolis sagrei]|uniref:GSK-3-binding protein-like n=1 Tax=Anolis sagrei TaxID=38937 RepID=UPI0035215C00
MPCRRPGGERLLLLQGGEEVDALVARLGEVLQLSAAQKPPPPAVCDPPRLLVAPKRDRAAPYASFFAASFHQHSGKQLCGRGWLRGRRRRSPKRHRCPLQEGGGGGGGGGAGGSDDPQRLLQQLILSGNLIKEAVRRLQRAASVGPTPAGEGSASPDSSAASSSSSSAGSWCPSSGGEGEGASP